MKNILLALLLYPFIVKSQGTTVDSAGNIVGYSKTNTVDTGRTNVYTYFASMLATLAGKSPSASPAFTGTVSGITATMVGLGNATNESKATMFTSPVFTGTPTGIIGGWDNELKVSGSDVTTTGQTLVDITGLVTPTLTVSSTYEIEVILIVSTSAVATGTEYGINCTGTGTTQAIIYIGPTTVTAGVQVLGEIGTNVNNTAATPAMLTTASETGVIKIWGYVTTGTGSPTIAVRHLKVTSGTSTVKIKSSIKYRKL